MNSTRDILSMRGSLEREPYNFNPMVVYQPPAWDQSGEYAIFWEERKKFWEKRQIFWDQRMKFWEDREKYWESSDRHWKIADKLWEQELKLLAERDGTKKKGWQRRWDQNRRQWKESQRNWQDLQRLWERQERLWDRQNKLWDELTDRWEDQQAEKEIKHKGKLPICLNIRLQGNDLKYMGIGRREDDLGIKSEAVVRVMKRKYVEVANTNESANRPKKRPNFKQDFWFQPPKNTNKEESGS